MKKVAIVAKAGTSGLAPWRDEGWEIWGLPWISYPRVNRLFESHSQAFADATDYTKDDWIDKTNALGVPVYCEPCRMHLFQNAVAYPLEAVSVSLPIPYLENSIAYQLALAIHEGADAIGLYGVHMMGGDEYALQRSSITYLVGLAQGRGIEVIVPPGSPLFMSAYIAGRYGVTPELRERPIQRYRVS